MHDSFHSVGKKLLTEIVGSNAIVHPRTVMIHTTDASIADSTMMRKRRFVRLAVAAHGMGSDTFSKKRFPRDRFLRYRARICESCFSVTS